MPDRYGENSEPDHRDPRDIAACDFCDDAGMRGMHRCDHLDHAAAARRGMAMIRQKMGWKS